MHALTFMTVDLRTLAFHVVMYITYVVIYFACTGVYMYTSPPTPTPHISFRKLSSQLEFQKNQLYQNSKWCKMNLLMPAVEH